MSKSSSFSGNTVLQGSQCSLCTHPSSDFGIQRGCGWPTLGCGIGSFSWHCDNVAGSRGLRKGLRWLNLSRQSSLEGNSWQQEGNKAAGHNVHAIRKQQEQECSWPACVHLLFRLGSHPMEWCPPRSGRSLPSLAKPFLCLIDTPRSVSMVILNPVKLTKLTIKNRVWQGLGSGSVGEGRYQRMTSYQERSC